MWYEIVAPRVKYSNVFSGKPQQKMKACTYPKMLSSIRCIHSYHSFPFSFSFVFSLFVVFYFPLIDYSLTPVSIFFPSLKFLPSPTLLSSEPPPTLRGVQASPRHQANMPKQDKIKPGTYTITSRLGKAAQ